MGEEDKGDRGAYSTESDIEYKHKSLKGRSESRNKPNEMDIVHGFKDG